MKYFLSTVLILFISSNMIIAAGRGSEKIKNMKENIQNPVIDKKEAIDKESPKTTKKAKDSKKDHNDNHSDSVGWMITKALFQLFFNVMSYVRYSEYPYSSDSDYHYADFVEHEDDTHNNSDFDRIFNFNINLEAAYLDDTIFSLNNRFMFNISALHINLNQQSIWSGSDYFNSLSFNLGLNLSIKNFQFAVFMGGYELNWPLYHHWYTSLGFSSMIFLPGKVWIDYYGQLALDKNITISMHTLSLNYSIDRVTLGAGYVYYDYADTIFHGPLLKISLWI